MSRVVLNEAKSSIIMGPYNRPLRARKKPTISAQTRLQTRPGDPKLDILTRRIRRLNLLLNLHHLISSFPAQYLSLNLLAKWAPRAGLNTSVHRPGLFLRKYPHIFQIFTQRKNPCCRITSKFLELVKLEEDLVTTQESEKLNVLKIKRLLYMSVKGSVHLHSIRLMRSEFGLPKDFTESIIKKYDKEFRVKDLEIVELVDGDEGTGRGELFVAEVEKWRQKEFDEKWLGEFEVKYAFPMNFPEGFKKGPGFKEKLRSWQLAPYHKVYEGMGGGGKGNTRSSVERYEKRAVGIIHEILWMTVEKRMEVERLSHFRKDLGILVNVRELLLKHPGIFYISIRGNNQMLFLREAYDKGCLIEPNPIYDVRRKMLDLVLLGARNTRDLLQPKEESNSTCQRANAEARVGDFVLQILGNDN